jgi:hypothetical protein
MARGAGVAGAIAAQESERVGENHAARGGVEAATIRVGDARIGGQCRGFAAASPLDALGTRKRVDVVEEKVLVFRERAEFAGLGQSCERVALGNLRERHGAFNELADAVSGKVAGGGGGGAFA